MGPTPETLHRIRHWPQPDVAGLATYVEAAWNTEYGFLRRRGGKLILATGGWSGNEELIRALQENRFFWMSAWESSERGGRHVFMVGRG
jgi:hypothetical protein